MWFPCCWYETISLPNATKFERVFIFLNPNSWYISYTKVLVEISEILVWLSFGIGCFTAYKLRQALRKIAPENENDKNDEKNSSKNSKSSIVTEKRLFAQSFLITIIYSLYCLEWWLNWDLGAATFPPNHIRAIIHSYSITLFSSVNPFIYFAFNKQLRVLFVKKFISRSVIHCKMRL